MLSVTTLTICLVSSLPGETDLNITMFASRPILDLSSLGALSKSHEGCFYRRRSDLATMSTNKRGGVNEWSYHNHVLQGAYLRYIRRPLTTKVVPAYRLVLVAGKAKGRLNEMLLHPESEVTTASLPESESPAGCCFIVNISGKCNDGTNQRWQLAMATSQQQTEWVEALEQAKFMDNIVQGSGEYEKLKVLTRKMLHEIDVRNRIRRFKIHRGVFLGSVAVKWISSELNCSSSNAVVVGNMMLNCGFFYHVGREHIFCDKKLYYRFDSSLAYRDINDPGMELLTAEDRTYSLPETDQQISPQNRKIQHRMLKLGSCIEDMNKRICFLDLITRIVVLSQLVTLSAFLLGNDYIVYVISIALILMVCIGWQYVHTKRLYFDMEDLNIYEQREDISEDELNLLDNVNQIEGDNLTDMELMLEEEEEEEGIDEDGADEEDIEDFQSTEIRRQSAIDCERNLESELPSRRRTFPAVPIPDVSTWPNRPLLARRSPNMLMTSIDESSAAIEELLAPLHLHRDGVASTFPIESDLFVGNMSIVFKNINSTLTSYFRYVH